MTRPTIPALMVKRSHQLERQRVRWFFAGLLLAIGAFDVMQSLFARHHPFQHHALESLLPTALTEESRTAVVVSGLALLLLARGMARGKRLAWLSSCVILGISAGLQLIKDPPDIEQAVLSFWVLLGLWWLRATFQVGSDRASLLRGLVALAAGAGLAVLQAEAAAAYILPYLNPRARWFAESLPWISGALILLGVAQLLRPVAARGKPTQADLTFARDLARRWARNPVSWLALAPGNAIFRVGERSLVPYRVSGKVAVALGDPIGPELERGAAIEDFVRFCAGRDWRPAFYQVESDGHYRKVGQTVLQVGLDAVVPASSFSTEGREGKDLRYALRRCDREGISFAFEPGSAVWDLTADELRRVSAAWLRMHRQPELGFSLGRLESLNDPDVVLATATTENGRLVAFASWLPVPARNAWALDLMRRIPDAPYGVMEALIARSILEARRRGLTEVSLGLALDHAESLGRPAVPMAAVYARFASLARPGGDTSLRRFKDKFRPRWEPRYLAATDPTALPSVFAALARVHLRGTHPLATLSALLMIGAQAAVIRPSRPVATGSTAVSRPARPPVQASP